MDNLTASELISNIEKELSEAVARELNVPGSDWKVGEAFLNSGNASKTWYIRHSDGRALHLRLNWHDRSKVIIDGVLERNPPIHGAIKYSKGNPEIQVTVARGPGVIAKEIVRRLLPGYGEVFAKNREYIQNEIAYDAKTASSRKRVADAFGVVPHERETEQFWANGNRVQVNGDSVTLELRGISVDKAVRIAEILKGVK